MYEVNTWYKHHLIILVVSSVLGVPWVHYKFGSFFFFGQYCNRDDISGSPLILWSQPAQISLGGALRQAYFGFGSLPGWNTDICFSWSWWRGAFSCGECAKKTYRLMIKLGNHQKLCLWWFWLIDEVKGNYNVVEGKRRILPSSSNHKVFPLNLYVSCFLVLW